MHLRCKDESWEVRGRYGVAGLSWVVVGVGARWVWDGVVEGMGYGLGMGGGYVFGLEFCIGKDKVQVGAMDGLGLIN